MPKINETKNGRFKLDLSYDEMKALVSMVYLEIGDGWVNAEAQYDKIGAHAGSELHKALQKVWHGIN